MAKNAHLTFDERVTIEVSLRDQLSFKEMGELIGKDPLQIAEMGVAHLRATELEQLVSDGTYAPGTLHVLKRDLSYAALIPDRHAFAEAYPEFAVDPAGIDDIMTLLVKGEVR